MLTRIITEGITRVEVPIPDENSSFPPSSAAVFYNPAMKLNRDITVALIACFAKTNPEYTYLDALSASGIRGLRIAKEVGLSTTMSDWEETSFELIKKNIELNNLSNCNVIKRNANVMMLDNSFDIIDLDPFGSPAPFLDAACRSTKRLLCITATDTAPLCGAHKKAGIRNYAAVPLKTEYYPEMGVRILMGAVARTLAKHDKAMTPLLSYASLHYVRLFASVKKSIEDADDCLKNMGFISYCFGCGARLWKYGLAVHMEEKCPVCGHTTSLAGPLWLGRLHERNFCEELLGEIEKRGFKEAVKLISTCRDELDIPMHYDYHRLCKSLGITAMPTDELILALRERGFKASRTHFSGVSFKADAGVEEIKGIVRELAQKSVR
ncbi:MAG: tRNA (guanine(10)-N(2))-dimethyltransferase [Euryarchaeota archaeon]|nr:tRNA (guanine(10)-N(2))-dimethyltransferase [Euryarchaeota archaeon]MBU4490936.1 tRNA (guanine(10)-N(2))-dimethyltransferase [Euryarchaeota archaeon]MCG2728048.1 tRNA (guanine(10)-N(2))-dimethyltransferase [Candidatus Methanoperedenaceae archaeon]